MAIFKDIASVNNDIINAIKILCVCNCSYSWCGRELTLKNPILSIFSVGRKTHKVCGQSVDRLHVNLHLSFFSHCVALQPTPPGDDNPTKAPREESRSWVMPFFIASMALLLVLFVALVIGITIWCHIQSRRSLQNVIVQAEDPQVVQRLTKLDDDESVCCMCEIHCF